MSRKVLLFAPCAFNLAETSRMVEIAKGVRHHPIASQVFDVHFYLRRRRVRTIDRKARLSVDSAGAPSHSGKD
jgi:hypothetical protein